MNFINKLKKVVESNIKYLKTWLKGVRMLSYDFNTFKPSKNLPS